MTGKTHAAVGAAVGAYIGCSILGSGNSALALAETIVAGGIGGYLPDSDIPGTKGRMFLTGSAIISILGLALNITKYSSSISSLSIFILQCFPLLAWMLIYFVIVLKSHSHRGFTHSLTALLVSAMTLMMLPDNFHLISLAFIVGMASHIIIDLLNTKGEQLFWPLGKRFCFNICSSNGTVNSVLFVTASIVLVAEVALVDKSEVLHIVRRVLNI